MFKFNNVKFKDILDIPKLTISDGQITCIIGPSGSGKSTLLKLLNKLISPTSGQIFLDGEDISEIDSITYRRRVPMLSQSPVIFPGTIRDNLLVARKFQNLGDLDDDRLREALAAVKLDKDLATDIYDLSGGEAQRVSIARLMLLDSDYYLLDEPSSALDDLTEDFVIQTMVDLARKNGKTLIYVTHSNSVSEKYSDRIIKIVGGKIDNE